MAAKKRKAQLRAGKLVIRTQSAVNALLDSLHDARESYAQSRVKIVQLVAAEDAERFREALKKALVEQLAPLYEQIARKDRAKDGWRAASFKHAVDD